MPAGPVRPVNRDKLNATIELLRELMCELEHPDRSRDFHGDMIIRIPFQFGVVQDGVSVRVEESIRIVHPKSPASVALRRAG